jgi:serine/threonine-protein kinase PknG
MAQAELLLNGARPGDVSDVTRAASLVEQVPADRERRGPLAARVLECALAAASAGAAAAAGTTVLGVALDERELRLGLERTYRSLARKAGSDAERISLVDRANAVRPRSWW